MRQAVQQLSDLVFGADKLLAAITVIAWEFGAAAVQAVRDTHRNVFCGQV